MNVLAKTSLMVAGIGISMSALASDQLLVTLKTGGKTEQFERPLVIGQPIVIGERGQRAFKAVEGCANYQTSNLKTSVEAGLSLSLSPVQEMGGTVLFQIAMNDTAFEGTYPQKLGSDCVIHMPVTKSVVVGPSMAWIPRSSGAPVTVFEAYSDITRSHVSLTLQIR